MIKGKIIEAGTDPVTKMVRVIVETTPDQIAGEPRNLISATVTIAADLSDLPVVKDCGLPIADGGLNGTGLAGVGTATPVPMAEPDYPAMFHAQNEWMREVTAVLRALTLDQQMQVKVQGLIAVNEAYTRWRAACGTIE